MTSLFNCFSKVLSLPNADRTDSFRVSVPEGFRAKIDFKNEGNLQISLRRDFDTMPTGYSCAYPKTQEEADALMQELGKNLERYLANPTLPIL